MLTEMVDRVVLQGKEVAVAVLAVEGELVDRSIKALQETECPTDVIQWEEIPGNWEEEDRARIITLLLVMEETEEPGEKEEEAI